MPNCLFESLNFYLGEKNNYELRKKIVKYIKKHPGIFEKDIIHNKHKSVEKYCDKMKRDGRDGDGIVLQACVLLYKAQIVIHFKTAKNPLTLDSNTIQPEKIIHLQYIPGHYSVYNN